MNVRELKRVSSAAVTSTSLILPMNVRELKPSEVKIDYVVGLILPMNVRELKHIYPYRTEAYVLFYQ